MEDMIAIPFEYLAARRTLLDALDALQDQIGSLVLIVSQAIYLHTGPASLTVPPTTTDADLALDPELLADSLEIRHTLEQAGFATGDNPGHWGNDQGIFVDLMVPPHVSNRPSGARAARLPQHDKMTARIGPGLALCLTDNGPRRIASFDPADPREHTLRVANPAGLLVAKTIKASERLREAAAGSTWRVVEKDALDIWRLLQTTDLAVLTHTLQAVPADSPEEQDVRSALEALADLAADPDSALPRLAQQASGGGGDPTVAPSFAILAEELLRAL